MNKRLLFLTGTRADFGKLKSLISKSEEAGFDVHIFATGMHLQSQYGYTVLEIEKAGFHNIFSYMNSTHETTMDLSLARTIEGLSSYIQEHRPDMIIIHGDRGEALAGAIVGALNNILVAHVEGGEISGTIDELIRHAISKLSHIHLVANTEARTRLLQMGEDEKQIYVIGSPDIDLMFSQDLPTLKTAKEYYQIPFDTFGICMFHPVTTEIDKMAWAASELITAMKNSARNFIVIFPNNDMGSREVLQTLKTLEDHPKFRLYPSLRFEYFLVLLRASRFILGNSSAGIREAPYYGIPTINIGTRQNGRAQAPSIIQCGYAQDEILCALNHLPPVTEPTFTGYGNGKSAETFINLLNKPTFWQATTQKIFKDRPV